MELRRCYSQFIKSAAGCLSSLLLLAQAFTPYFFCVFLQEGGRGVCIFIFHCVRVCVFFLISSTHKLGILAEPFVVHFVIIFLPRFPSLG